ALTPIAFATSATLTTSEIRITRFDARGTVISVLRCSLPGSARRFCGRLPPRMKSRSRVSSMSDFLMTFRPFFFFGAPSAGAASVPGAASPLRPAGAAAGGGVLRRSILPSTLTPRISSKPGAGATGTAGRAAAGGAGGAGRAAGGGAGGGASATRCARTLSAGSASCGVWAGASSARGAASAGGPGGEAAVLLQPLRFLVGERALRALAADAELRGARQHVLRGHAPFLGQLVDTLWHPRYLEISGAAPSCASRRSRSG